MPYYVKVVSLVLAMKEVADAEAAVEQAERSLAHGGSEATMRAKTADVEHARRELAELLEMKLEVQHGDAEGMLM